MSGDQYGRIVAEEDGELGVDICRGFSLWTYEGKVVIDTAGDPEVDETQIPTMIEFLKRAQKKLTEDKCVSASSSRQSQRRKA